MKGFRGLLGGKKKGSQEQGIAGTVSADDGGSGGSEGGGGAQRDVDKQLASATGEDGGGPYIFGCFDCNGKCGLKKWKEMRNELQEWDTDTLIEEGKEREVAGASEMERDELLAMILALEELAELRFESRPKFADITRDLKMGPGDGVMDLDFSYHLPATPGGLRTGEERHVRDEGAFIECLSMIKQGGMHPLAIELHPRTRTLHLDCFDAGEDLPLNPCTHVQPNISLTLHTVPPSFPPQMPTTMTCSSGE